jgi:hypothetical protein
MPDMVARAWRRRAAAERPGMSSRSAVDTVLQALGKRAAHRRRLPHDIAAERGEQAPGSPDASRWRGVR